MELSNELKTKYSDFIKMMKNLRFDDYEIENKIIEMSDLEDWEPISLMELQSMTQSELDNLKSYCWHEGIPRCSCIGITDVKVITKNVNRHIIKFSDNNGGTTIELIGDLDSKIDNVGDGEWNYGIYKNTELRKKN